MKKSKIKLLGVFVGLLCLQMVFSQKPASLKQLMSEKANNCYLILENWYNDGANNINKLIDDSANGYLTIEGITSPCGCNCRTTVGAYKDDAGNYTLLEQEYWTCSLVRRLSSDRQLEDVLPEGFDIGAFIPQIKKPEDVSFARFYVSAEIPRKGMDTQLTIQPIPFGLYMKSKDLLCYEIQEKNLEIEEGGASTGSCNYKLLYTLQSIIYQYKEDRVLSLILDGKFDQIPYKDRVYLEKAINEYDDIFGTTEDVRAYLMELKQTFDLYQQLEHESVTLGWDRTKGRFYIKDKGTPPKKKTFLEFLQQAEFFFQSC